jgi:hypothetical protein
MIILFIRRWHEKWNKKAFQRHKSVSPCPLCGWGKFIQLEKSDGKNSGN